MKKQSFRTAVLATVCASLLNVGCVTTGTSSADNSKPSAEQMAKMDRDQQIQDLIKRIDAVGDGKITSVSMTADELSEMVLAIANNQKELMISYRDIAKKHRDVQSFLRANEGKTDEELKQAIIDFDKVAKNQDEKISPKLLAYEKANDDIFGSNVKLAVDLGLRAAKVTYFTTQNSKQLLVDGAQALFKGKSALVMAAEQMKDRIDLAMDANAMIRQDKAVVEIAKQLQTMQSLSSN